MSRVGSSFWVLRDVARSPDLRRLGLAFLGFNIAEWSVFIALLVYAYGKGGAAGVGLFYFGVTAPAAVFAPFGALLGDRFQRGRVLMAGYALQAAADLATGAAMVSGSSVLVVYLLAAVATAAVTLTRPAQGALMPWLAATAEELTAANAVFTTVENASVLVGPALTGIMLAVTSPGAVWMLMGVILLGSAALVVRLRLEQLRELGRRPVRAASAARELLAGFSAIAGERGARVLVSLFVALWVEWGALDVLLVVMAIAQLGMGQPGVGFLNSALGAGGLLGLALTAALVGRRRLSPAFVAGIITWGVALAAIGAFPSIASALALLALAGAGRNLMDVAGRTLLQRAVPNEILSRVLGVMEGLYNGALGLGAAVAPALIHLVGVRGAFIAAGVVLAALALAISRPLARIDALAAPPGTKLGVLLSVPMFSALGAHVIEGLAASLVPLEVAAGEVLIREGEAGDRLYLIGAGEFDVSVGGHIVTRLGPGDHFGEIALLRNVPRTATVTAISDGQLYALDAVPVIDAVSRHPLSAQAADAVMRQRLDRGRAES